MVMFRNVLAAAMTMQWRAKQSRQWSGVCPVTSTTAADHQCHVQECARCRHDHPGVVWCGVWCVVCGVCGVCGVWCVWCGVWCAVCGVVCGVWCMVCGVWCVVCGVVCGVWCVVCGV